MKTIWRRYAAWTLRQASTTNCGHLVGAALAVIALAVTIIVKLYWAVIVEVVEVVALTALAAAAAAAAYGCYRLVRWIAARRSPSPAPASITVPCARRCGRSATGEVTWANGVRTGTESLCTPCYGATEAADRVFIDNLDARRERSAAGFLSGGPVLDPAAEAAHLEANPVPSSEDNRPATDTGTAADLAAVLRAADIYRPGHP